MPLDEHQVLHDIARDDNLVKTMESLATPTSPPANPEKAAAMAAQRDMENQLGRELTLMFDRNAPISLESLPAKYDKQRLLAGVRFIEDPGKPAEQKRVVRDHLTDVLGRLGGVEFLKRNLQL